MDEDRVQEIVDGEREPKPVTTFDMKEAVEVSCSIVKNGKKIQAPQNIALIILKGLHALRGKNGPFRKWFISSYVVAYVILITKYVL